jgi:hypothetical protein
MSWYDTATGYIGQIHVKLPADATYAGPGEGAP